MATVRQARFLSTIDRRVDLEGHRHPGDRGGSVFFPRPPRAG